MKTRPDIDVDRAKPKSALDDRTDPVYPSHADRQLSKEELAELRERQKRQSRRN
jgi:hypothetical protein